MFSIGDLSRRTGVKVPTIRYYEQMGLVAAPERSEGNQRRYSRQELERLAFIRHARDGGRGRYAFSLLWFAAALACKTSTVCLPVFLAVCYGWRDKTATGRGGNHEIDEINER